jgi:hypothetical protein
MNDKLKTLGIKNGSQLDCDDYKQQLNFKLIVMNSEKLEEDQFEFGNVKVEPESVEEKVNGEGPVSSSSPLLSKMDITEPNEDDGPSSLKRSRIE